MGELDVKIHWLRKQYSECAAEAAMYIAKAEEKMIESRKLHRELTHWLKKRKSILESRKIKPSPFRNPKTA